MPRRTEVRLDRGLARACAAAFAVVTAVPSTLSAQQLSARRVAEAAPAARDLFALPPRNTVAIKASYWYGR